jgi:hypothetical protein
MSSSTPLDAPSLTPKSFKEAIGKFNEDFAGNEQHDAQELLAFLLSGLTEDLNRIMKKPYIEAPDSDGRPDEELADIWWTNHLQRELSIIEALFTGQYKSTSTCKTCKYESARFEPFAYLQVPLPEDDQISVQCLLYPMQEDKDIMKYSVRVRHDGKVIDVLLNLAKIILADEIDQVDESFDSEHGNDDATKSALAEIADSMAVVDMGESHIRKIVPVSSVSMLSNPSCTSPLVRPTSFVSQNCTSNLGLFQSLALRNLEDFPRCTCMKYNLLSRARIDLVHRRLSNIRILLYVRGSSF